jgi:Tol biopolymer transport system component
MTVRHDFDLTLREWLAESASSGTPDYLEETLDGVWRIDQPAGWMRPWSWLGSLVIVPRRSVLRGTPVVLLVTLFALVLVAAMVVVGSRQTLPSPFGLARSGLLALEADGDIYLAQPDGSHPELFIGGPGDQFGATWSPDGRRVAYFSTRDRLSPSELWIATLGGGAPRKVVGEDSSIVGGSLIWSPDGDRLVIATGTGELWRIESDGTGKRRLGDPSVLYSIPSWSPDGALIAVRAATPSDELTYQGHLIRVDDGSEIPLGSTMGSGIAHGGYAWSGDGTALLYHLMRSEEDLDIAIARMDAARSWREDVLIGGLTRDVLPSWSNDGNRMAFIRTDGFGTAQQRNHLMVANADGTDVRTVDDRSVDQYAPCWSPDDRVILASSYSTVDLRPVIVLVGLDGTDVEVSVAGRASTTCSWQRLAP